MCMFLLQEIKIIKIEISVIEVEFPSSREHRD